MTARRVRGAPGTSAPGPLVTFTFDGHEIEGVDGEPLAVSLLAAGRPILSRSFRFHRPRGLMCSTGQCGWCECEVDGVPSVRSCRVPVRAGLTARGEHALPSVEHDLLSFVGLFSRWIPPTFYHHRFLRPRRLRKRYLDVLRWFGGRGRLHVPAGDAAGGGRPGLMARQTRSIETDVLVVGGGRAGLLAGAAAAEAGARVVLVEAERAIGADWRTERGSDDAAGSLEDLDLRARAAGVDIRVGTAAVGWYDGVVMAIGPEAHLEIAARTVVAATGSYDRVPLVPGADRPGVIAARTVIGLVARHGVLPGDRALLVGSGPELGTAAELLSGAGVTELHGPVPTGSLVAIHGSSGVAGADLRIDGRRQHIAADVVVFGDRSPNLDLVLAAGASVERHREALVPVVDGNGRTSVPTLFVVGSAAGRPVSDGRGAEAARGAGRTAGRDRDRPSRSPRAGEAPRPGRPRAGRRWSGRSGRRDRPGSAGLLLRGRSSLGDPRRAGGRIRRPRADQAAHRRIDRSVPGQAVPPVVRVFGRRRRRGPSTRHPDGKTAPAARSTRRPRRDAVGHRGPRPVSPTRTGHRSLLDRGEPPASAEVVIVGAGIAGLAFARELAARGVTDVVVLDRGYPGGGATGRNVARIRAMQLTEELTHVALACQAKYDRMGEELGFNVLFYRVGYAWVLYTPDEVERMRSIVEMHHRIGVDSRFLSPDETLRRLPILGGGEPVAGAVLHDDAIVHHDAVVWAHLEHLARSPVRVMPGTTVRAIVRRAGRVEAVDTDHGRIATRSVLNATDGWSTELNAMAGVDAPNRPLRREVLVTAPLRRTIEAAVTFYRPTEGWFNQTLRGEIVMGVVDPDEPAGVNQASSWDFLRRTAALMTRKAPALADVAVIRQWAGMYDVSPDHQPLVGPTRQLDGWWQANGWSGRGMLLAPYLGELLAERFVTGVTEPRLAMFDPDRFAAGAGAGEDDADYYARYAGRTS